MIFLSIFVLNIGTGGGSKSPPSNVVVSHIDQALLVVIGGCKSPSLFASLDMRYQMQTCALSDSNLSDAISGD